MDSVVAAAAGVEAVRSSILPVLLGREGLELVALLFPPESSACNSSAGAEAGVENKQPMMMMTGRSDISDRE
eukprot:scaffold422449_cov83-Attheya_sp.AAC.1